MPLLESMKNALSKAGYAPFEHSSEVLTTDMIESARLIITMTEEHRHRVNRMSPAAVARTFTLRELDRLLMSPPWATHAAHDDPVRQLHALRPLVPRGPRPEDLADPALGSGRLAEAVLRDLVQLVSRVAVQLTQIHGR
jgi:protein-tyrosine phosphatase